MVSALVGVGVWVAACALQPAAPGPATGDLKHDGAFGFPQKEAKVVCDTPELRVSAWSNREYLYVQAVLPTDGDDSLGETEDGRAIGDSSMLLIDVNADGKPTPEVDRHYSLNPWPSLPGLQYQVVEGEGATTGLMGDSKGRGAISYVEAGGEAAEGAAHKVRVDCFLIPLAEIKRHPGDTIRLAYWGKSPKPELTVNSVGFTSKKAYYFSSLPWKDFGTVVLADGAVAFNERLVPEGRQKIAVQEKAGVAMPAVGTEPPQIAAGAWLNWKGGAPPTLKSLRGKVVVVEFWATWCGPCVSGIPHLNQVHDELAEKGLVILSLTDQAKKDYIENFMTKNPMRFTVGVGSKAVEEYGVHAIPQAFVIGRDGRVAWEGLPSDEGFEKAIGVELGKK